MRSDSPSSVMARRTASQRSVLSRYGDRLAADAKTCTPPAAKRIAQHARGVDALGSPDGPSLVVLALKPWRFLADLDHMMRTSTVRLVLSLGTVLLLAGCASSSPDESSEPAAPSSPVASESTESASEPTPTPTEISIEDAGARYLELVEPVNALVTPWNQSWEAGD